MNNKINQMKELIEKLNNASKYYYQYSNSIMTDFEYDKLYDELVNLEKETGMTLSNSPTINIEYKILSSLEQVEHPEPMLSLAKTKKVDELANFLGDKEGLLSWKLDGLTIVLTYEGGKLIKGVTRGNGIIGEVITENVKRFKNIPLTIAYKGNLVLRGEAIIKYSDFKKINEELDDGNDEYKNPRNLCSGSVRQLDSNITSERNVYCIIFALISASSEIPNSKIERFKWLNSLGFDTVEYIKVTKETVPQTVLKFKEKIINFDIPSDGLVLTYDDAKYGESLGSTAKYPRHSLAFKWQDTTVETEITDIDWSPSRTGLINPVAVFKPVEVEGTIVSRASLHNLSIMDELKIGIGDKVLVYKANMIIPQIGENLTKSNNLVIPDECPACHHPTTIINNNDVKYLYCTNKYCVAKLIKKLSLFTSRNAMNIDGLSDAILTRLISEELVKCYSDIYKLEQYKDKIISFDGFGEKSYNNLIESVNKSRKVKVSSFIYALGITEIGLSRAKLICNTFKNDYSKIRNVSFDDLKNISGIGEVIANEWVKAFDNEEFTNEVDKLLKEISFVDTGKVETELQDMVFVITGEVNHFKNRDELIAFIENYGGKVISAMSKNVNYLINNDITSNSTKNVKAKELGIPIISEDELMELVNK